MTYTSDNIVEIKPQVDGVNINLVPYPESKHEIEILNGPLDDFFQPSKTTSKIYENYDSSQAETYTYPIDIGFNGTPDFGRKVCADLCSSFYNNCESISKAYLYIKWEDTNPLQMSRSLEDFVNRIDIETGTVRIQKYMGNFLKHYNQLTGYPEIIGSNSRGSGFGNYLGDNQYDVLIEIPFLFRQDKNMPGLKDLNSLRIIIEFDTPRRPSVKMIESHIKCDFKFNASPSFKPIKTIEMFTKQVQFAGTECFSRDVMAAKTYLNFYGDLETLLFNIYYVNEHEHKLYWNAPILHRAIIRIDGRDLVSAPAIYFQGLMTNRIGTQKNTDPNLYAYTFANNPKGHGGPNGSLNATKRILTLCLSLNKISETTNTLSCDELKIANVHIEVYAICNNIIKIDSELGVGSLY
eukprot:Pompholyxophrys_sp_v1_NODE_1_length_32789_cov_6.460653.p8 type:complete len:408 gc:universal NODE_1_length_32789_cov_6.460653:4728-3505(-)